MQSIITITIKHDLWPEGSFNNAAFMLERTLPSGITRITAGALKESDAREFTQRARQLAHEMTCAGIALPKH